MELTNDRDHILWHAKTDEYCPEEGSVNGVVVVAVYLTLTDPLRIQPWSQDRRNQTKSNRIYVRFGKVNKAYIQRNLVVSSALTPVADESQR